MVSRKGRVWWKNLRGGAPVTLRVRGQDLKGTAEVMEDDGEAIVKGQQALHPRWSREQVAQRAQDRLLVRIRVG